MFDDKTFERLTEGLGPLLLAWMQAKLPEMKQWPRWMSVETAGAYIDKTYGGMRYTLSEFPKEIRICAGIRRDPQFRLLS